MCFFLELRFEPHRRNSYYHAEADAEASALGDARGDDNGDEQSAASNDIPTESVLEENGGAPSGPSSASGVPEVEGMNWVLTWPTDMATLNLRRLVLIGRADGLHRSRNTRRKPERKATVALDACCSPGHCDGPGREKQERTERSPSPVMPLDLQLLQQAHALHQSRNAQQKSVAEISSHE